MQKFRVRFTYDKENTTGIIIEDEDIEMLYGSIVSHKEWFRYDDERGVTHAVNMKLVTNIQITEYKPAGVTSLR